MSKSYFFSALARQDLIDINDYIAKNDIDAADRFLDRIYEKCQLLANFPNMGAKRDELMPGLRSFPVGDYLVFIVLPIQALKLLEWLAAIEIYPRCLPTNEIDKNS